MELIFVDNLLVHLAKLVVVVDFAYKVVFQIMVLLVQVQLIHVVRQILERCPALEDVLLPLLLQILQDMEILVTVHIILVVKEIKEQ